MTYLFNHEASQSNYGGCLSAAGDKAEFLYSAFADVKMPQFNSSYMVPNIIGMVVSYICQKANCGSNQNSGGMLFTATRAKMVPPHGYRQPSVSGSIWSPPVAYGRIIIYLLLLLLLLYYNIIILHNTP
jgi:hypothetical protein